MGGQGDIEIIVAEVEEGAPKEPPMTLLALTIEGFRGKEIDPIIENKKMNFLDDESLLNLGPSSSFYGRITLKILRPSARK